MSGASSLDPGRFPNASEGRLKPRATWGVRRRQGRKWVRLDLGRGGPHCWQATDSMGIREQAVGA